MAYETYQQVTGTIREIQRGDSCCTFMISIMTDKEMVQFVVSGETQIIDNVRLRNGMRIAAFYDANLPTPAVYPPRYQAELITALRGTQQVKLAYFDSDLTSADNTLKLNLTPFTNTVTANGQRFSCQPTDMELLVYYTTTTFSIPAQTTPQKIIVMCLE